MSKHSKKEPAKKTPHLEGQESDSGLIRQEPIAQLNGIPNGEGLFKSQIAEGVNSGLKVLSKY